MIKLFDVVEERAKEINRLYPDAVLSCKECAHVDGLFDLELITYSRSLSECRISYRPDKGIRIVGSTFVMNLASDEFSKMEIV